MKKTILLFIVISCAILLPAKTFAWGKRGHEIVAEIAFSLLDSNTKNIVQKYLDTVTIEKASIWMDEMRSNPSYDYMKPWHYVNIEKGHGYVATTEDNIINRLNKAIYELGHKDTLTDKEIKMDLLLIFHLIGDLHMPLHTGYAADECGNDVHVKYNGKETSLHWLWDNDIIEHYNITLDDCLARVASYNRRNIKAYEKINVMDWVNESHSFLDNIYDFKGDMIDQAYADKNKPIIEDQLVIAGIRLASVLNKSFKQ